MRWSAQGFLWLDARTGIWDKTAWSLDWEGSWLSGKKLKGNFERGHLGQDKHSWIHSTIIWLTVKGQPCATPQGKREWMITVSILYSCHLAENWVARSSTINPEKEMRKGRQRIPKASFDTHPLRVSPETFILPVIRFWPELGWALSPGSNLTNTPLESQGYDSED